jgi:hypothetical protein
MQLSFRQFLVESAPVGQFLRSFIKPEDRANFVQLKQLIDEKVKQQDFPEKLHGLMVNFILGHGLKHNPNLLKSQDHYPRPGNLRNTSPVPHLLQAFSPILSQIRGWKDFLVARKDDGKLMSQLNNLDFTPEMLTHESEDWHHELEARAKGPGPEGKTVLDLNHIGWKGWKWISLDKGYCKKEGDAAGHCGNAGAVAGDNILSLRDPQNFVRLTFIVNNGVLGESKGRGNDKPAEKYHPAILELLKSPLVRTIRGGGYAPENNFQLSDLSEGELEALKKVKPDIDYFDYVIKSNDPKLYGDLLNTQIKRLEGEDLVIDDYETWKDLYSDIKNDKKVEDFSWLDDPHDIFDNVEGPDIEYLIDDMDRKNKTKAEELLDAHLKEFGDEDEDEDMSFEEKLEKYEELGDAIRHAGQDGAVYGSEAEAYKYVQKQLSGATENGFWVDFTKHPYSIRTSTKNVKSLWSDSDNQSEIESNGLSALYDFEYSHPYNGYSAFDKNAFNERLSELLSDLESQQEKEIGDSRRTKEAKKSEHQPTFDFAKED